MAVHPQLQQAPQVDVGEALQAPEGSTQTREASKVPLSSFSSHDAVAARQELALPSCNRKLRFRGAVGCKLVLGVIASAAAVAVLISLCAATYHRTAPLQLASRRLSEGGPSKSVRVLGACGETSGDGPADDPQASHEEEELELPPAKKVKVEDEGPDEEDELGFMLQTSANHQEAFPSAAGDAAGAATTDQEAPSPSKYHVSPEEVTAAEALVALLGEQACDPVEQPAPSPDSQQQALPPPASQQPAPPPAPQQLVQLPLALQQQPQVLLPFQQQPPTTPAIPQQALLTPALQQQAQPLLTPQQQAQLLSVLQQQAQIISILQQQLLLGPALQQQPQLLAFQQQAQLLAPQPQLQLVPAPQQQAVLVPAFQQQAQPAAAQLLAPTPVPQQQVQLFAAPQLQPQHPPDSQQQAQPPSASQRHAQPPSAPQQQAQHPPASQQPAAASQEQAQPAAASQEQAPPPAAPQQQAEASPTFEPVEEYIWGGNISKRIEQFSREELELIDPLGTWEPPSSGAADGGPVREHAFSRLPQLPPGNPSAYRSVFSPRRALGGEPVALRAPWLQKVFHLLAQEQLSPGEMKEVATAAELLIGHLAFNETRVLRDWPTRAAAVLGLRFLMLDFTVSALQLLGVPRSGDWWETTVNRVAGPNIQSFTKWDDRLARFNFDLVRRLTAAIGVLKTGQRPSANELVHIKRCLFCSKCSPLRLLKPVWDSWREADRQFYSQFETTPGQSDPDQPGPSHQE
ncbi:hypothetical protein Emed_004905 [Eimeria media]